MTAHTREQTSGLWLITECCGQPIEAEGTHNGVMPCLHYVCCGWGHGPFDPASGYATREDALNACDGVSTEALRDKWVKDAIDCLADFVTLFDGAGASGAVIRPPINRARQLLRAALSTEEPQTSEPQDEAYDEPFSTASGARVQADWEDSQ